MTSRREQSRRRASRIPRSKTLPGNAQPSFHPRVCSIVAGALSPLLANIYLHCVLDLWTRQWREQHVRGDVIIVRYANDSVVGFRTQWQPQQYLVQLQERLAKFGLSLNASKTRLIELVVLLREIIGSVTHVDLLGYLAGSS